MILSHPEPPRLTGCERAQRRWAEQRPEAFDRRLFTFAWAVHEHIDRPRELEAALKALAATDWVVYAKPCHGHTEPVAAYLVRDGYRIALGVGRVHEGDDGRIGGDYCEHADGGSHKRLWLQPAELIRRFCRT